jgi:hypothetical protein
VGTGVDGGGRRSPGRKEPPHRAHPAATPPAPPPFPPIPPKPIPPAPHVPAPRPYRPTASPFAPLLYCPPPPRVPAAHPIPPRAARAARAEAHQRTVRGKAVSGICLVVGIGLLLGACVGRWIGGDSAAAQPAAGLTAAGYAESRDLWHSVSVDSFFPRTLKGPGAGPGGADRTWIRIGVAPDSDCDGAFDPALAQALAPVGCRRLLRATYTDATSSNVTTVGLLITRAGPAAMARLRTTWSSQHLGEYPELMPRPMSFPGTDSAGFGLSQRASWQVAILDALPAVVYAVSGFADGRTVAEPQPADAATVQGATSVPAQAGLGYDARGIAAAVEQSLAAVTRTVPHTSAHGTVQ